MSEQTIRVGPLAVDLGRHTVRVNGIATRVGGRPEQRTWRLLECLSRRTGQAVPYRVLAEEVLGWPDTGSYELKNLRQIRYRLLSRLGPSCSGLIRVIPGWGMCLDEVSE